MIDLANVEHHPAIDEIVEVLCNKTQNTDRGFFRTEVAYFLAKMASSMRAVISTKDRGEIPVNLYALALATSGFGKGHSVNIMENEFIKGFRNRFIEETMPIIADKHIWAMADSRALRKATDQQVEYDAVNAEYNRAGAFPFTFDSGTPEGVKQLRHKLLLAGCGSINLQIDEIGSKLIGSTDVLTTFLELYDQGMIKQKLVKNTNDNIRGEEIDGKTPTNMLLFGTPSKLLDGSQTEDQFYSFLDTGYARRCIFGFGKHDRKALNTQTPEEIYQRLIHSSNGAAITKWAEKFTELADPAVFGWRMTVDDDVAIQLITYKNACEKFADTLPDHDDIRKAELSHRFFKALKLAGAYAFIDLSSEIEMGHVMQAILLVEESGSAFQTILTREKAYVKLARYIACIGTDVTHADLHEALPFYKSSNAARNEMMTLATAWGYKKHIVIKKSFVDGIEFFTGETLKETNIDELTVSYSDHWAYNYQHEQVPFSQIELLCQAPGMHWANHQFKGGHRCEENVVLGFNMIVLDIDGGVSIDVVHNLLSEYKFATYTTKRHSDEEHRFRLLIPINYQLELGADDYREFMTSFTNWLPFQVDDAANQRSRKWASHEDGTFYRNEEGIILDVLQFIPKTSKNEEFKNQFKGVQSLDNLERWFAQRIASGNRNNQMLKYALALVDGNMSLVDVQRQVHEFNNKLNNALSVNEIDHTIMVTVAKRYHKN